ncbi:MAG TPA: MFS transporter [Actinobacteria bacterium]|nr:MFS transporter [Actinomycetota bacterium]
MTSRKGPGVLAVLAASMFVYVIDTTLMNVSITALVDDLGTTVGEVQVAITLYTLTMAAFMLTGGKLGDLWGSKRAFRIGLVVYGVGTTVTALAPTIGFVILGWSFLEGLGSALIVPAINTLVRTNYDGARRASAYGVLFGVAAAGAAFGPLVGGWVTTTWTWRLAFAGEAVIVLVVLAASRLLADAPPPVLRPGLDLGGVAASALGLGLVVFGILQTTSRGWTDPLVLGLVVAGAAILAVFVRRTRRREAAGLPVLLHLTIFRHRSIRLGLPILSTQLFAQAGLLFLVPVFTQAMLGFSAFETGVVLLPLSFGVLATALLTPPLGRRIYPKDLVVVGMVGLFLGGWLLARALPAAAGGPDLAPGLLLGGLGIGVVVGQLPNLVLSGVDRHEASEASGLQATAQNLGMALGTAVIGTVILAVGLSSMADLVEASPVFPPDVAAELAETLADPFERAHAGELEELVAALPPDQRREAIRIYRAGAVRGFQAAVAVGGVVALVGAGLALRLPRRKLDRPAGGAELVERVVRAPVAPRVHFDPSGDEPLPEAP